MYHLAKIDRLFVVRWEQTTLDDLRELDAELILYHEERRQKLFYVSLSDDDTTNPSPRAQKALVRFLDDHQTQIEKVYIVLATRGFAAATQRAVLSSMMLLSGRRGAVDVHRSFSSVLSEIQPHLKPSLREVQEALVRDRIVRAHTGT